MSGRNNPISRAAFLPDGRTRTERGLKPVVAAEVRAEFAAELARAGWLRSLWLEYRIHREIRRRIRAGAPAAGLY